MGGARRGQRTWHVWREASGTWETLFAPAETWAGRTIQSKKRTFDGGRESDQLIVLRGRESRPHFDAFSASHGKGADEDTQLVKETFAGHAGSEHK